MLRASRLHERVSAKGFLLQNRGVIWSTWLDPTQNPPKERPWGSKALVDACQEHRYIKDFSRRTIVRRRVYDEVARRWHELELAVTR